MFELIGVTLFILAIFGFSLVLASSPDRKPEGPARNPR